MTSMILRQKQRWYLFSSLALLDCELRWQQLVYYMNFCFHQNNSSVGGQVTTQWRIQMGFWGFDRNLLLNLAYSGILIT